MKPKSVVYTLLCVLFLLLLAMNQSRLEPKKREPFGRQPGKLAYTGQALCVMDCRGISKEQIAEIMEKGIIHFNRSDRRARPCPIYALQGRTAGGAYIRVLFEQCPGETSVVNCYNLEEERSCSCSGNLSKQNR